MAAASTIKFGNVYVLLENPATTALDFVAPCGVEQLTMTVNVETQTTNVPDCTSPDLPAWLEADIVSQQMTIEGEGVLDRAAMKVWQEWWYTNPTAARQVRFYRNLSALDGGGHFQGPAILSAYSETGQRGGRWRQSFTITFSGKPTFTAAP